MAFKCTTPWRIEVPGMCPRTTKPGEMPSEYEMPHARRIGFHYYPARHMIHKGLIRGDIETDDQNIISMLKRAIAEGNPLFVVSEDEKASEVKPAEEIPQPPPRVDDGLANPSIDKEGKIDLGLMNTKRLKAFADSKGYHIDGRLGIERFRDELRKRLEADGVEVK